MVKEFFEALEELSLEKGINKEYLLDAIEQKKNIDTVIEICELMTSMPSKRNTYLVSNLDIKRNYIYLLIIRIHNLHWSINK